MPGSFPGSPYKGKIVTEKNKSEEKLCQNPSLRPACKLSSSYCCLHLTHLLLSTAALPGQRVQELRVPRCWESCPHCQGRRLWAESCLCWSWKGCVCLQGSVEVWWCASGGCQPLVCELFGGRNSSEFSVTLPTQISVHFSVSRAVESQSPWPRAGPGVSVTCTMVASEGNEDLLGIANPGSKCHSTLPCGTFNISCGLPAFRSCAVWLRSGCQSLSLPGES